MRNNPFTQSPKISGRGDTLFTFSLIFSRETYDSRCLFGECGLRLKREFKSGTQVDRQAKEAGKCTYRHWGLMRDRCGVMCE